MYTEARIKLIYRKNNNMLNGIKQKVLYRQGM